MGGTQNAAPTPKIRVFPPKKITAPPPRGPKGPPPTAPLSPPRRGQRGFYGSPHPRQHGTKRRLSANSAAFLRRPAPGGGCGGGQRHVLGPFVAFSGPSVALSAPRGRSGARRHAGHVPARRGEGRGEAAPKKRPFGGRKIRELAGSPENGAKSMETGQKKKKRELTAGFGGGDGAERTEMASAGSGEPLQLGEMVEKRRIWGFFDIRDALMSN